MGRRGERDRAARAHSGEAGRVMDELSRRGRAAYARGRSQVARVTIIGDTSTEKVTASRLGSVEPGDKTGLRISHTPST